MSSRPADVHIDDLADPILPPQMLEAMEAAKPMADALDWTAEGLLGAASSETGLSDFNEDGGFRDRIELLLKSLDEDHNLHALGKVGRFTTLVRYLKNRLLLEDLYKRHPEIDLVEIARPIIIAGMPRSGTTHTHNLLSADPQLRSLPYWEALEPVPIPGEEPGPDGEDPRIARAHALVALTQDALPYFKRMHEMHAFYVHEEIDLLALDMSTMFWENLGLVDQWREWYRASDQTPHYAYLKKVLKALQWMRGPERWVLKSPQHLEQLRPIMEVFPDATVVCMHRDPVSIVASLSTMVAYSARLSDEKVDVRRYGEYWKNRTRQLLEAVTRDRGIAPAEQSMDIRFHELVGHDMERVEDICQLAGNPLSEESRNAMIRYAKENPQGVNGRVIYRLEDFGLDGDALRAEFRFYTDHFDLQLES